MPYVWQNPKVKSVGNADGKVSPFLKAWIKRGDNICCGVIGEGSSLDLQANWETPFEGANFGSFFSQIGGLIQINTDATSETQLNSTQVWGGNRPLSINLILNFYTLNDAVSEVEDALAMIKEFASPQLNAVSPAGNLIGGEANLGRIPDRVMLNVGRNFIYPKCVISSASEPFDVVKDSRGNRLSAVVTLAMETDVMINSSDIRGLSST